MKNVIFFITAFAYLAFISLPAQAETSIAVVDVQSILAQSNAAKSIEKQITDYKEKFLDELSKQEQALRLSEKELDDQRGKLSKEDFSVKAKALEEKFIETGSLTQSKKRMLDKISGAALNQLHEKLYEVVQTIAKERGYNLVITKQNVIVGEESMDITVETMTRLNKALPDLTLDFKEN